MTLHIHGPSYSTYVRSVMLCCEEKGIDYTVGTQEQLVAGRLLADLHPYGRCPLLLHGGRILFESAPICRYIDNAFEGSSLQSAEPYQRAVEDQWAQALTCYIDKVIVRDYLLEFAFPKGEGGSVRKDVIALNTAGVLKALGILECQLGDNPFLCGEQFSVADALLVPMLDYLSALPTVALLFEEAPNCLLYIERLQQRESCKRVLEKVL